MAAASLTGAEVVSAFGRSFSKTPIDGDAAVGVPARIWDVLVLAVVGGMGSGAGGEGGSRLGDEGEG